MKNKKIKIWVGDFETITPQTKYYKKYKDTCVYLGGFIELYDDESNVKLFRSIKEFLHLLKLEYRSGIVYFHNLNFDGDFIYKFFIHNNIPYLENHKERKTGYHVVFLHNQVFQVIYNFTSKRNGRVFFHKIYFRCSYRLLSNSVEQLGKTYGIDKFSGDEDDDFYNNEPDSELSERFIQYLKNDIIIVKRALVDFEKGIEGIEGTDKMKRWYYILTIGSLSYKLQKKFAYDFSKKNNYKDAILKGMRLNEKELELANKFYYGGWTQFNQKVQYQNYKCKGVGIAIDINSAHPYGMTKLLPFGNIYKKEDFKKISEHKLVYYHLKVKRAECKYHEVLTLKNWKVKKEYDEYSEFGFINGRYCRDLKNFECYYLKEEWEILQNFYNFEGVKIIQEYWCNAEYYLKDYTETIYKLKVDNEKNSKKQTYKILLNAGYGKHAQRKDFKTYVLINKENLHKLKGEFVFRDKLYLIKHFEPLLEGEIEDIYILHLEREKLNEYGPNKLIASTITAYTRINLWNEILFYGPESFLYGDTDSIRVDTTLEKWNEGKKRLHNTAIGKFSLENIFSGIEVAGAKRYRIFDDKNKTIKIACSGFNKKYLKTMCEGDEIELFIKPEHFYENAKLSLKRCKNGSVLEHTDLQLKRLGV
ncbi:MAG: DNA polymerase [Mycoplasmoidaceae bacterium]